MTGAMILAAGAASRMGTLKQLLPYRGGTLLSHAVDQALGAGFEQIAVVVGAQAEAVREAIAAERVHVAENIHWPSGMGSSITVGMRWLQENTPALDSVAVLLADQPLVQASHLRMMLGLLAEGDAGAIAAEYNGTLGVPAIFRPELFDRLATLPPDVGARYLLRDSRFRVLRFPLPEAAIDLDTPEDFAALTSSS